MLRVTFTHQDTGKHPLASQVYFSNKIFVPELSMRDKVTKMAIHAVRRPLMLYGDWEQINSSTEVAKV